MIAGLALAPLLVNLRAGAIALLSLAVLCAARPPLRALTPLFLLAAAGLGLALRADSRASTERAALATLDPDRFVVIEAPLERGWSQRDDSFVLRASTFHANGVEVHRQISIYARFEPSPIVMQATVRAEGFLKENEHGDYVISVKSPLLLEYQGRLSPWHPAAWNRMLANRLDREVTTHPEEVALAEALLLGRGERLTEEMRESFRRGGTYHLLVFSGLQIAFAAGILAALLRWLHAPRASDWLLLVFAAGAPLFIGASPSVSRASVAIALYAVSRILRRPTSIENLWCVAALLRLAFEPGDLSDPSFHLTYAGAGALLFIGKHLLHPRWISHAAAAEVTIAPLTLHHFHQYTLGGSLLTLAMSPLIFAMLVASLLACAWPRFLDAIRVMHRICGLLNALGLSGYFAAPPLAVLIFGGGASMISIAMLRGSRRAVAIALAMLLPAGAAIHRSSSQRSVDSPQVTFFDVGQGDAIGIRSGEETMLVDGGRDPRLLGQLADLGVRRIDTILLSHAHPDHCDTLPAIIEQFEVGRVLVSPHRFRGDCAVRLLAACSATATPIVLVRDHDRFRIGAIEMTAHVAERMFRRSPENNSSVVLHGIVDRRTFLLTGDIEKEAELHFDDREWRADVVKIAHHGSRSSTSQKFLDLVKPRVAVISCGRRNLFGHPHPSVLGTLAENRIRTWRTDRDGTIVMEVRAGRVYVSPRSR